MTGTSGLLRRLLNERFTHQTTGHRIYPPGQSGPEEIATIHRLHLILSGRLDYFVHGEPEAIHLDAGTQTFATAWIRRRWTVPGPEPCEMLFLSFETGDQFTDPPCFFRKPLMPEAFAVERSMFTRLHSRHDDYIEQADELWAESEMKGSLGRFFFHGDPPQGISLAESSAAPAHPLVHHAQTYLLNHLADADAIRLVCREISLTPNYLRRLFLEHTGQTLGQYLLRVRMQRARYLLQATPKSIKEIAAMVGFRDALHFSRRYAGFWKSPPSHDRKQTLTA